MTTDFFPRDRTFWLYHCSAMALGLAMTVLMFGGLGGMTAGQLSSSIVWMPVFTLAMLGFRWLHKHYSGTSTGTGKLLLGAIIYSGVAGVLIAAALQVLVWPFHHDEIRLTYQVNAVGPALFRIFMGDMTMGHLFAGLWSFIYLSVTATRRVRQAHVSNLKLQNALKEAQLSSLSNQLNPHFLFNALNNIRFMVYENARHADDMITALSEILRYSLDSSKHDKIALQQEIAIIEKYIALVKTQFEERLQFSMDVPASLRSTRVPPMVLQMLVENAVKHGLERLPQGGRLDVAASADGRHLSIAVCNDTPPRGASSTEGMGIGLRNIEQRLLLLYGDEARLDILAEDTRFTARLTLPLEHK